MESGPREARQQHPKGRGLAVREVLPSMHWPGKYEEEECGRLSAHYHKGLWQTRTGELIILVGDTCTHGACDACALPTVNLWRDGRPSVSSWKVDLFFHELMAGIFDLP